MHMKSMRRLNGEVTSLPSSTVRCCCLLLFFSVFVCIVCIVIFILFFIFLDQLLDEKPSLTFILVCVYFFVVLLSFLLFVAFFLFVRWRKLDYIMMKHH